MRTPLPGSGLNVTTTPTQSEFSNLQLADYLRSLKPEAERFLQELVETNSFTGNPQGVEANASAIRNQFAPFGFHSTSIPCALPGTGEHLILDSKFEGPTVLLVSHLDTVYSPEEELRCASRWETNGRLATGPGAIDIKGGTAMMWMVLQAVREIDAQLFSRVRWVLAWNAAEERLTPDFSQACLNFVGEPPRCCLIFEGDNAKDEGFEILSERPGWARFHVQVKGRGAHSGNGHREGINAILQLALLIEPISALTDYDRALTVNVGIIRGGASTNRVPDLAEAWIEVRFADANAYADAKRSLLALGGSGSVRALSDGKGCEVTVEVIEETFPWASNSSTADLAQLWTEAARDSQLQFSVGKRGGLSDANFFWEHTPTLDGLGPRGGNYHTIEHIGSEARITEFVDLDSLVPKAQINTRALVRLLSGEF